MIASERMLTHFNPDLPLLVSCDASPYGLGAVLSCVGKGRRKTNCICRVRTRFGIYEKVFKMTVPNSRAGKGLEMRQKHEKVWKITLA